MIDRNRGGQAAGIVKLEWKNLAHDSCLNMHFMHACILSCFIAKLHHMELPTQGFLIVGILDSSTFYVSSVGSFQEH